MKEMERIHRIQQHPLFLELYEKLCAAEEERIFCRHTMEHFLDVARLMYIYNLEEEAAIDKEWIYAAALLHDIGRYEQITKGTPHDIAGAEIAAEIMSDCGFEREAVHSVCAAIEGHRSCASLESRDLLTKYLYTADKMSRNCFACAALAECDWPEEKKNMLIYA